MAARRIASTVTYEAHSILHNITRIPRELGLQLGEIGGSGTRLDRDRRRSTRIEPNYAVAHRSTRGCLPHCRHLSAADGCYCVLCAAPALGKGTIKARLEEPGIEESSTATHGGTLGTDCCGLLFFFVVFPQPPKMCATRVLLGSLCLTRL